MSVYRIYNQGEIARFAGACPGPRVRALRGRRINLGRGLALGYRSGARPQMDHHPRLDDARTARLPLDLRRRLQPRPTAGYSRRRIRAAIKTRLSYVSKTRTIRAAVASLKLQP